MTILKTKSYKIATLNFRSKWKNFDEKIMFFQVKNIGGELKTIPQLMNKDQQDENQETIVKDEHAYRNISLQMHTSTNSTCCSTWWEVLEVCVDKIYKNLFEKLPYADCTHNLVLYTFSDKLFPETLSIFTAGG